MLEEWKQGVVAGKLPCVHLITGCVHHHLFKAKRFKKALLAMHYLTIKSRQLFTSFDTAHVAIAHSIHLGSQHLLTVLWLVCMHEALHNPR